MWSTAGFAFDPTSGPLGTMILACLGELKAGERVRLFSGPVLAWEGLVADVGEHGTRCAGVAWFPAGAQDPAC